jgi:PAS domain S-box-containing protein
MNLIVEPHGGEFKPCNIFIVEDEALIAMEIKDRLKGLGYKVCGVAARGEVALPEIARAKPDLVLMDIHLAGEMNGIETAARLARTSDIPVIYLTAYSDDGLLRQAADTGPFGYLVKPFEGRELHVTIQMALYKHRMERRLRAANEELQAREIALTRTAEKLNEAQRIARVGSWDRDLVSGEFYFSDEAYHIFEVDKEKFGVAPYEAFNVRIPPEDFEAADKAYLSSVADRTAHQHIHRLLMPDGRIKWIEQRSQTEYDKNGKPLRSAGTMQDITERVEFMQALSLRETQLNEAQHMARVGSWVTDLVSGTRIWSDEMCNIFGIDKAQATPSFEVGLAMVHPDDRQRANKVYDLSVVTGAPYEDVYRLKMPDGRIKWVEEHGQTEYDGAGKPVRSFGTVQDITERKRIELAMKALSTDLIQLEGEAYFKTAAARLAELLGAEMAFITRLDPTRPGELQTISWIEDGRVMPNFSYSVAGTPCAGVIEGQSCIINCGVREEYPADLFLVEKSVEGYAGEALLDHVGRVLGHLGVMSRRPLADPATIMTTLKMFAVAVAAEIVQERHKQQYEDLFEFAPSGMVMTDQQGRIALVNREAEEMFGYTRAEMLGQPIEMLVAPERRAGHRLLRGNFHLNARRRQMGADRPSLRGYRKDGSEFPAEIDLAPVESENGIMVAAAVRDITARKLLEARLAEAMKMDAIGKLTGGMAHDFNNYLGVIIGNLDLLKERESDDPASSKLIDAALGGALRGAELTQSLLAFSRRQPLDSRVTDVNRNIETVANLLQRSIGKNITLTVKLAPDLWPVKIDSAQFDSCIINLTNNAGFAMPEGGSLMLETSNDHLDLSYAEENPDATPGDYVLIKVSDTGTGMSPETMAQVFEPFFTTKGVGHGTGLGLSMVYGFVKQSGGHIKIYSEVGHGTTVRFYLPRETAGGAAAVVAPPDQAPAAATLAGGEETILVVEDNELVRRTVVKQLGSLGYKVIEAGNGEAGLAILQKPDLKIDLLFTDIVMPGKLDGYELAKLALAGRPKVKILLTSGFPGDTLNYIGKHAAHMSLLGKPYRKNDLAREVRRVLDLKVE